MCMAVHYSAYFVFLHSDFPQNVEYVELCLAREFPLKQRRFLPNVYYSVNWTPPDNDSTVDNRQV